MKRKIHFVCRGNVYRSRLAEAIFRKIGGKDVAVSSSGIETWRLNLIEPTHIRPDVLAVCEELDIKEYLAPERTQTTSEILNDADLIVFMDSDVYHEARLKYAFNSDKAVAWHVADWWEVAERQGMSLRSRKVQQRIFKKTALKIWRLCERLDHDVNHLSWTDIVDEDNSKRGFSLPVSWACQKGLWWRGCHVVVTTPNGNCLVEKRSKIIVFGPGMLDVTLGGGVDSGESPLAAAQREMREELGIAVPQERFKLIDARKWDSYHPRYRSTTRIFLYTYHCVLNTDSPKFMLQQSEVESVKSLSPRQLSHLLRYHRLSRLGHLKTGYKYFEDIVRLSELPEKQ